MRLHRYLLLVFLLSCTLCSAQDTVAIKNATRLSCTEFDSMVNATGHVFHTESIVVDKISGSEFASRVKSISEKKRVIVFVWAAWCHFSIKEIKKTMALNNSRDTVIFLSADIPSKAQVSYIKEVAEFYNLPATYLIADDFIQSNMFDDGRVKAFLRPISKAYDGGYPYYIVVDHKAKVKEGYKLKPLGI